MCEIAHTSPQLRLGAATVQCEANNAALASAAAMARAVRAATYYRAHGHMPAWATPDRKDHSRA